MGIEKFFNSLASENEIKTHSATRLGFSSKLDTTSMYIDFNSIVYTTMNQMETELNYILWEIITKETTDTGLKYGKIWNIDIEKDDITRYKSVTDKEKLKKILIDRVEQYIYDLLKRFISKDTLKTIYIAVDGVPTISKMVEQKKRRYAGYLAVNLKKRIYAEYKSTLSEERLMFEENKPSLPRSDIIPHSKLMKYITSRLSSDGFKKNLKKMFTKLTRYVFLSADEFGEGEKKIAEDVIDNVSSSKENITVFSPDADVIILSMIFKSILKDQKSITPRFDLIRFNQQSLKYDFINIDNLYKSIHKYIIDHGRKDSDMYAVVTDICFLFTLFGNDFVPRIKSIDARIDFEVILKTYAQIKGHILNYNKREYELNVDVLNNYTKKIGKMEKNLIRDKYMLNNYKNFRYIRSILGGNGDTVFQKIRKYVEMWNEKNDSIDHIRDVVAVEMNIDRKMVEQMNESDLRQKYGIIRRDLSSGGRTGRLRFVRHKDTINNDFHKNNIKKSLPHHTMRVTQFDQEAYSMDRQIGRYKTMLNAKSSSYGFVGIDYDKDGYNIISNEFKEDLQLYHNDIEIKDEKELTKLVNDYMVGVFWVTSFYFNMNNRKENLDEIPLWFYKQERAPMLTDIINHFNYKKTVEMYDRESEKVISLDKFFTPLEHYIYVTPVNSWRDIPEKYEKVGRMMVDLNDITDKVYNNEDTEELVDCRGEYFLNKCKIIPMRLFDYKDFIKLIRTGSVSRIVKKAKRMYEKTKEPVFKRLVNDCNRFLERSK